MQDVTSAAPRSGQQRHRKLAAFLASGLVLSIGTMATLASWNDSEFASATFTAGRFDVESSTDNGASYASHPITNGAITFTAPAANMSPGDVVNASFPVRLAAGTTNNARFRLNAIGYNGAYSGLTTIVWQNTTSSDCNATYTPATALGTFDGSHWTLGTDAVLTRGATAAVPGPPAYLCIRMIADSSLPQGQVVHMNWQFLGTSQ